MSMKVHNAELYVEAMQSADWSLSEAQKKARDDVKNLGKAINSASALKPKSGNSNGRGGGSNIDDTVSQTIDALAGKRAVLEAEFHAKMEIAKRESDRRSHEKSMRQERQFDDRYGAFMAKNKEIVAQSAMHEEVSSIRERKRERLYQEWMQKVFLPMQNEINNKIESANTESVINFRNQQYQAYLDECNRKEKHGGIHRDVIVETQYNPFVATAAATVRYQTVGLSEDPLKNRVTRESKAVRENAKVGLISSSVAKNDSLANPSSSGRGASRFVASNGTYAQAHAHANKFALLPSEALGTTGGVPESTGFGASAGMSSARAKPFLPSVGSVSLNINNANPKLEPSYKYSANNSLYSPTTEAIPLRSTQVEVKQWGRMDATPHGRYSHDNVGPTGRPRVNPPGSKTSYLKSDLTFDHYNIATGTEGVHQVKKELGLNTGKRCNYIDKSKPSESPLV